MGFAARCALYAGELRGLSILSVPVDEARRLALASESIRRKISAATFGSGFCGICAGAGEGGGRLLQKADDAAEVGAVLQASPVGAV